MFEKLKINEKDAGVGPFLKKEKKERQKERERESKFFLGENFQTCFLLREVHRVSVGKFPSVTDDDDDDQCDQI